MVLSVIIWVYTFLFVETSEYITTANVVFVIAFLSSVIANIIQLRTGKHEIIHKTDTKTVASQEKLISHRDKEIKDLEDECEESKKKYEETALLLEKAILDREAVVAEYKVLAGIDIKEILNMVNLRTEIGVLKINNDILTEELKKLAVQKIQLELTNGK